ncbi:UNKNOWN [Stylonychia lemnae]|uniref:Uncharacterized protein n=1 Tax=Stylonychia lemnae TaxID=5949 RepID=A0A078ATR4_STYLE|nr:UNKNOWN [Stylonychia lemnae]|eukprot:CDW85815.1 UNKNOWN [Stylonychia lemnae]
MFGNYSLKIQTKIQGDNQISYCKMRYMQTQQQTENEFFFLGIDELHKDILESTFTADILQRRFSENVPIPANNNLGGLMNNQFNFRRGSRQESSKKDKIKVKMHQLIELSQEPTKISEQDIDDQQIDQDYYATGDLDQTRQQKLKLQQRNQRSLRTLLAVFAELLQPIIQKILLQQIKIMASKIVNQNDQLNFLFRVQTKALLLSSIYAIENKIRDQTLTKITVGVLKTAHDQLNEKIISLNPKKEKKALQSIQNRSRFLNQNNQEDTEQNYNVISINNQKNVNSSLRQYSQDKKVKNLSQQSILNSSNILVKIPETFLSQKSGFRLEATVEAENLPTQSNQVDQSICCNEDSFEKIQDIFTPQDFYQRNSLQNDFEPYNQYQGQVNRPFTQEQRQRKMKNKDIRIKRANKLQNYTRLIQNNYQNLSSNNSQRLLGDDIQVGVIGQQLTSFRNIFSPIRNDNPQGNKSNPNSAQISLRSVKLMSFWEKQRKNRLIECMLNRSKVAKQEKEQPPKADSFSNKMND